jgi:4-alpha-glucanotransferase
VVLLDRKCGILLPLLSLPGGFGTGDLGKPAANFIDFLKRSGQSIWQVLPLTVTDGALGNSPYSSPSAFAGNPLCISLEGLLSRGLLDRDELLSPPSFPQDRIDYGLARLFKEKILRRTFARFSPEGEFKAFQEANAFWLDDFVLFSALKTYFGGAPWIEWPEDLKRRDRRALLAAEAMLKEESDYLRFVQYIFFSQLEDMRTACREAGVELIGDLPIYVNFDSSDVWANQSLFCLSEDLLPTEVAGVPPDYFSKTGQLWGNPLYNWSEMRNTGFSWWLARLHHSLAMFDLVRIDHFRGLLAYWAVPFGDKTAERGTWRDVPSEEFFARLKQEFPSMPFLAENLGIITPDVTEAMEAMELPGMAVALFGFGGDMERNPHIPHNYRRELAAYTGTHDNNTAEGWYSTDATEDERKDFEEYAPGYAKKPAEGMVRLVMGSVAGRVIIPLQDYLGLGQEGRINTPSTTGGNWEWRTKEEHLSSDLAERMARLAKIYGRK